MAGLCEGGNEPPGSLKASKGNSEEGNAKAHNGISRMFPSLKSHDTLPSDLEVKGSSRHCNQTSIRKVNAIRSTFERREFDFACTMSQEGATVPLKERSSVEKSPI
ncbi:hypothetical protein ANN_01800 [Periplaneta americana]|uniref:Uncharacterized protein n=1 Tax=Periplaneta americana TaxID=6978 RepID=A0ABQ8TXY7_PERAM|nr:hypothetical protein ANN_01800 [Periplaneta americana]